MAQRGNQRYVRYHVREIGTTVALALSFIPSISIGGDLYAV